MDGTDLIAKYLAAQEQGLIRKPGKCLRKGMRDRRIIYSSTENGVRVELHATKGWRRYSHI